MSEPEIEHAVKLLQEISDTGTWEGGIAFVQIDEVCRVRHPSGRCMRPVYDAVVLLHKERDKPCHVIAVCEHHAEIMKEAVKRWREHS